MRMTQSRAAREWFEPSTPTTIRLMPLFDDMSTPSDDSVSCDRPGRVRAVVLIFDVTSGHPRDQPLAQLQAEHRERHDTRRREQDDQSREVEVEELAGRRDEQDDDKAGRQAGDER